MNIAYVTSNTQKFEEAIQILTEWDLQRVDMDITEIQGSRQEIAHAKAMTAVSALGIPVIVEDVSVCCHCLNGLPGPYAKDFLKILGDQGLCDLVHKYPNHRTEVICTVAYATPGSEPIIFDGAMTGTIVNPRGDMRHGTYSWNPIFLPDGEQKTMGEMTLAEHAEISMRRIALDKLKHHLEQHSQV